MRSGKHHNLSQVFHHPSSCMTLVLSEWQSRRPRSDQSPSRRHPHISLYPQTPSDTVSPHPYLAIIGGAGSVFLISAVVKGFVDGARWAYYYPDSEEAEITRVILK